MSVARNLLMHSFGRPQGFLGRLGGVIMARMNAECGAWVTDLIEVEPSDRVLEIGFGPGVVIQLLSKLTPVGNVAGIDSSLEMVEQARARNAIAIESGHADLRHGSVERLPFDENSFDKALAINSMHVWPDAVAGLREMGRVIKQGRGIALGFPEAFGQGRRGDRDALEHASFRMVAAKKLIRQLDQR